MMIDLDDVRIRGSVRRTPNNMARITIDYPREEPYRRRIMSALAGLIDPDRVPNIEDSTEGAH